MLKKINIITIFTAVLIMIATNVDLVKASNNNEIQCKYTDNLYGELNSELYSMNKSGETYKIPLNICGEVVIHIKDLDIKYKSKKTIKSCGLYVQLYEDSKCKKKIGKKYSIDACGSIRMGSYYLDGGTHYLKVWSSNKNASGNFKAYVVVKQHKSDEVVNKSTIKNPNNIKNKKTYKGFLSQTNKSDFYRIFVNSNRKQYVTIRCSISSGGKIDIIDSKQKKIKTMNVKNKYSYVYEGILKNGVYFIKISTKENMADTKLRVDIDNISLNVKQRRTPKYTECKALAWGVRKKIEWSPKKVSIKSKLKYKTSKERFVVKKSGWYTVRYTDIHNRCKTKQVYVTLSNVKKPIITEYKKNTNRICGKATGCTKVVVKVNNKVYKGKVKNNRFTIKVARLKKGNKIIAYGKNKNGDISFKIYKRVK